MEYVDLVEHSQSMQAPYFYEGFCDGCERVHRLPRSDRAVAASQALMERFRNTGAPTQQPKMYGVLVGRDAAGARRSLQAFSGQLEGQGDVSGWVPSVAIPPSVAAAERRTLSRLEQIRLELALLDTSSLRANREQLRAQFEVQIQSQKAASRAQREHRAALREELAQRPNDADKAARLEDLNEESRQEGMVLRRLKAERATALQPLQAQLAGEEQRRQELKAERRTLSRALQEQMHAVATLTSLGGQERPLQAIYGRDTPPTGTGECCAPKLLQAAAREGIRPEGMAEFWWGAPTPDGQRQTEHFYGACEEKCVPIMGHLLCGLEEGAARFTPPDVSGQKLEIVYEDAHLWVVDKPSGLLSVPGRGLAAADSVLSRLALMAPKESVLKAVHRLDMDTSGLLLIARTPEAHRHVSQQFAERRVEKRYEALVNGAVSDDTGEIALRFRLDPSDRPRQVFDPEKGTLGVTTYRVLERGPLRTRLSLVPHTGRTHQLRVHCAHPEGLGCPIVGDRLYGDPDSAARLLLHAVSLVFVHPVSGKRLSVDAPVPF